ncbi:glycosyltransferase family 4 protein [Runella slithyformis]|uniref:Glycosyl transferase group 1 n=1 Tax=Runella slithyformis (strain ATCC 29530 / DSM 19594 / LMG 11500 / NCIMB 11436 / LSU 4) TaxID=761193 RepID=A0A7U3ZJ48_RUNSL|nr:glycosyltransferase family 4 protein [Runella slithyformis]AEI48143.1 glycosyl transferase group 1 [Runella slithyformis DSM 19594]
MKKVVQTFTVPVSLLFLEGQIEFWQKNGYDVHVLTAPGDELTHLGRQNKVKTSAISLSRRKFDIRKNVQGLLQFRRYFRQEKPLIVHGNTPKAAFLSMIAAKMENIPIRIYEMHGLPLETARLSSKLWLFLAEKLCCWIATHVIAVSPSLRKAVIGGGLVAASKISVMHHGSCNGVDTQRKFNPSLINTQDTTRLKKSYGISPAQPVVGFVGRLTKDKGVIELYKAWQRVKRRFPEALLLVIGEVDERVPLSKQWLARLDADESIIRTGHVTDMPSHYALMDFLVLPSYREGLGNVVLEAAAMKKPSIVSRVTGLKDTIVKNQTGIFCQVHSVEDLTDKIIYYLENKPLIEAHGNAARERVAHCFCPNDVWNEKLQLYQRLVAAHESVLLQHELS